MQNINKLEISNKKEIIKKDILKGREHVTHYSEKIIPARKSNLIFDCNCKVKCNNLLSDNQKIQVFKNYNELDSHSKQYLLLRSLIIPVGKPDNKIQKFEYFIETKSEENAVTIALYKL